MPTTCVAVLRGRLCFSVHACCGLSKFVARLDGCAKGIHLSGRGKSEVGIKAANQ
jgi:hypothetical protein